MRKDVSMNTDMSMLQKYRPRVFIVILNWNREKEILDCIESVYGMNYDNYKIIVVDNGSNDNSVLSISKRFEDVHIINNIENMGFAGGSNIGIQWGMENGAEYIWLLNNDVVVEKDALSEMIESGEREESVGLISPVIYYHENPDIVQNAGSRINWKKSAVMGYATSNSDEACLQKECEGMLLWGTALLIKRSVIENIGKLNDKYFAYWEDTEYSLRALRNGLKNVVCSKAKVYHKTNKDILETCNHHPYYYYYMFRNRMLLIDEYSDNIFTRFNAHRMYLADIIRSVGSCWRYGRLQNIEKLLLGAWHGLKGINGPMVERDFMPRPLMNVFIILAKWHPFFIAAVLRGDIKELENMIRSKTE